jgi:hypothetical protein
LKFLNGLLDNATKGIITTLLGVIVILAALTSVFLLKAGWVEVTAAITLGVGLIFSPDKVAAKASK